MESNRIYSKLSYNLDLDFYALSWRSGYVTLLSPVWMMAVIQWQFMGHEWGIWCFDRSISHKDRIVSYSYMVHNAFYWELWRKRKQWFVIYLQEFFAVALRPNAGHGLLILEVFYNTHNDVPQSVGLLWTSDQLVAETSTWQHTTLTTDKHPCPRWDSKSRSQQASGRRPTP